MALERKYEINPLADIFPPMDAARLQELANDIQQHGLMEPAQLDGEGRILDGRNRYVACEMAMRLKCFRVRKWKGPRTPEAYAHYIAAKNLHRRDLTATQRATALAKLYQEAGMLSDVGRPKLTSAAPYNPTGASASGEQQRGDRAIISSAELAKEAGVSKRTAAVARAVVAAGEADAVIAGAKTASQVLDLKPPPVAAGDQEPELQLPDEPQGPMFDRFGNELPPAVERHFEAADALDRFRLDILAWRRELQACCERNDPGFDWAGRMMQGIKQHVDGLALILRESAPWCLCPNCSGDATRCKICGESGYLNRMTYTNQSRKHRGDGEAKLAERQRKES